MTLPRGHLIYLMGASGAGKDSLLLQARPLIEQAQAPIVFAHRYITRPASAGGENHVALSEAEFAVRLAHDCFCMTWDSHGLRYGIGIEVLAWMERGLSVVVNGSRGYLEDASARFGADFRPVAVTVSLDVLRQRLERRGRETPEEIEKRLARAAAFSVDHPALSRVDNSGALEDSGRAFAALLLRLSRA